MACFDPLRPKENSRFPSVIVGEIDPAQIPSEEWGRAREERNCNSCWWSYWEDVVQEHRRTGLTGLQVEQAGWTGEFGEIE